MMTTDCELFSAHEVILNNAASTSVFENPDLLTYIAPSATPTMIGDIQKGAPGVRIDDVGSFLDLGRVGREKGASCNILSACQMKNTGRVFSYDNDKDEFVVTGTSLDYVFTRRLRDDGTMTRFYTRDFAHVAAVAAILRRYSVREVKQVDKAE